MGIAIAALWGFAESTLFFFVPDIWLTRLTITHTLGYAIKAALYASMAALLGGTAMILWSYIDADTAYHWVESVPAISPGMMLSVSEQLEQNAILAIFSAAFSGTPYKTLAVQIMHSDASVTLFLLATIPARLSRFLLTIWLAHRIGNLLRRWLSETGLLRCWLAFWCSFYIFYFSVI